MTLRFTTTDQSARLHGVKFCVHGRGGAGKTTLVNTLHSWPTTGPCLLLSAESGTLSLGHVSIPEITLSSFQELEEAYNFVTLSRDAKMFQSVALDSISEIAEQCLGYQKGVKKDGRAAYGEMGDEMRKWIRKFRDLPGKHVYFSAKQSYHKDEVTGVSRYAPSMPGQSLTQDMPYFWDELFSLEVGNHPQTGESFRYLRTKINLQYECKDRSGALNEYEEPHLGKIVDKIMSKFAAGQPQPQGA